MPAARPSMYGLESNIWTNPYGGVPQTYLNAAISDDTNRYRMQLAQEENARLTNALLEEQVRGARLKNDPVAQAMASGDVARWQAGFFRNNPDVREAERKQQEFAGETQNRMKQRATEAEAETYWYDPVRSRREDQTRIAQEAGHQRYVVPAQVESQWQNYRTGQQSMDALAKSAIDAGARTRGETIRGIGDVAAEQAATGDVAGAQSYFRDETGRMTGADNTVSMAELWQMAQRERRQITDVIQEAIDAGMQVVY